MRFMPQYDESGRVPTFTVALYYSGKARYKQYARYTGKKAKGTAINKARELEDNGEKVKVINDHSAEEVKY